MDKGPIEWRGGGRVVSLDPQPIPLRAVCMAVDRVFWPGVELPTGQLIFAGKTGALVAYLNEQQALESNPGATIARAPYADAAMNGVARA